MVTGKQRREIQKRMRAIKDAKDDGASERKIKEMTSELAAYLDREGLTNIFDE